MAGLGGPACSSAKEKKRTKKTEEVLFVELDLHFQFLNFEPVSLKVITEQRQPWTNSLIGLCRSNCGCSITIVRLRKDPLSFGIC